MDFTKEAALIFARLGRARDHDLERLIEGALRRAYEAGHHEMELKIAIWGDITPDNQEFILNRLGRN